ncbi:MAG: PrsW family glutamic-type intramembrane protease [Sphaerochaeta sp.]|jgi:RsiW-degrading membrane proteinase PrsW (M82 family)|nr:PrsW family glutamic-type intramembrane protease [Sphaerochaeta sp.]MCH3919573.1 PrsW family glutamic-type intramembrane protease [Sphaerochaeta sp.]MCI2045476.1 PrsW family glutamic-type intramembrane protease [Sphaerochaeta sp.]MCI2096379.1 PrsW family glutamic-type intramembrane protease [Sphaerochaeta sp.]MCI2104237.1 PrsW family glutamic-type intramembrane protease [Sphaerochaeta sp.]
MIILTQAARIVILIYLLAALLPGYFILRYIYSKDTIEKEDPRLLGSLLLQGVWAALCSIVLESIGELALDLSLSKNSPAYVLVLAFLVVAVVEEGTKFFFLKRRTWNIPDFNYTFDAIVYAVFVSMGFAMFENVKYVFGYGLGVALPRAFLAVPGHMGFAVFMGYFYGKAKVAESNGQQGKKRANLIAAYLSAVLLHGIYDSTAMMESPKATVVYLLFVAVLFFTVYRMIKRESAEDRRIS